MSGDVTSLVHTLPLSCGDFPSWRQILMELAYSTSETLLATTTTCPDCKKSTLKLVDNPLLKALWSYCSCGFSGTILDLAAEEWKISVDDAIDEMVHRFKLPHTNKTDCRIWYNKHVSMPKRWHAYLRSMAATTTIIEGDNGLRSILTEQGVIIPPSKDKWFNGLGRIVGGVSSESGLTAKKACLVMPNYFLPGYITSVVLLTLTTNYSVESKILKLADTEFGLLGAEPIFSDVCLDYDGRVVIFDNDPSLMLKLQHASLDIAGGMLPICSTAATNRILPTNVNGCLGGLTPIYYVRKVGYEVVRAAMTCGMRIADHESVGLSRDNFTSRTPDMWIRKLIACSKSWLDALDVLLVGKSNDEINSELERAGFDHTDLKLRLDTLPSSPAKIKLMSLIRRSVGRFIVMGSDKYLETEEGWFKNGILLSNTRISIDVIKKRGEKAVQYDGHIDQKDSKALFSVPAGRFERGLSGWLVTYSTLNGMQPARVGAKDSQLLLKLAYWFSKPKIVDLDRQFGWSDSHEKFLISGAAVEPTDVDYGRRLHRNSWKLLEYLVVTAIGSKLHMKGPDLVVSGDYEFLSSFVRQLGFSTLSRRRDISDRAPALSLRRDRVVMSRAVDKKDRGPLVFFGDRYVAGRCGLRNKYIHLDLSKRGCREDAAIILGILSSYLSEHRIHKQRFSEIVSDLRCWYELKGGSLPARRSRVLSDHREALISLYRFALDDEFLTLTVDGVRLTDIVKKGPGVWFVPDCALNTVLSRLGLPEIAPERQERILGIRERRSKNTLMNRKIVSGWLLPSESMPFLPSIKKENSV